MKRSETQLYLELLKRRVATLRLMAKELRDCRESITGMDLESTREHISYQQGLCSQIRFLDGELETSRWQLAGGGGLEPDRMSDAEFGKLFEFDAGSDSQFCQRVPISAAGSWLGRAARQPGQVGNEAAVTNPAWVRPASTSQISCKGPLTSRGCRSM